MVTHRSWSVLLLAPLVMAGCKNAADGTAHDRTTKDTPASRGATDLFAAPPNGTLTVDELAEEQGKNEQATQEKYRGKVLALTGVVRGIGRNLFREPLLTLKGKSESLAVPSTEPRPWDKVSPGQHVKLKVLYQDSPGKGVRLVAGPILEVTGEPNPTMTAEQLAKQFEADPKAAKEKYGDDMGGLVLTGTVLEVTNKSGVPEFSLKAGPKYTLHCEPDRESAQGLKPGMNVKVTGYCWGVGENASQIRIVDCLVLDILGGKKD